VRLEHAMILVMKDSLSFKSCLHISSKTDEKFLTSSSWLLGQGKELNAHQYAKQNRNFG
jgi:hypothetical protein